MMLKVLNIEDSVDDSELVARALGKGGLDPALTRVDTAEDVRRSIKNGVWDIILSDYVLPGFDALGALSILQESGRDIPFVIVSGAIGEEMAVEAMKLGASDFVNKNNLSRLIPVVRRELREAITRREKLESQRAKEEILAIVSHDLRNPIASMILGAEFILENVKKPDKEQLIQRQAERIRSSAERMNRIASDILDISKIDAGRLVVELKPEDAGAIVMEAVEMFSLIAKERNIAIDVEVLPERCELSCDKGRIIQILANLMGNAIKFSGNGSAVSLGLKIDDGHALFSVRDAGPGISPEELPRIFERFFQGRRAAGQGSGLGLSIAKGLVEAHGGTIWAESAVGKGSAFYFKMPVGGRR